MWHLSSQTGFNIKGDKHVVITLEFAKDESSILSTSIKLA